MKNIYLTRFQIGRLNSISDKSNCYKGCHGSCFKYKDGVLKVFYQKDDYFSQRYNIQKNIKRESPIFVYPEKELFEISFNFNKIITPCGYWSNNANGDNLLTYKYGIISGSKDISFDSFIDVYYDRFLPLLMKESVIIDDLKLAHIFYSDNFSIVDTDSFCDSTLSNIETYRSNLMVFNKSLFCFFENIDSTEMTSKFYSDIDLRKDDCIYKYIKHVRNKTRNSVNSFGELSRFSK